MGVQRVEDALLLTLRLLSKARKSTCAIRCRIAVLPNWRHLLLCWSVNCYNCSMLENSVGMHTQ
jgi:hypothetical protein